MIRSAAALGIWAGLAGLLFLQPLAGTAADNDPDSWTPVPFRVRNLTFPTVLAMGFKPAPVVPLPRGSWAVEVDLAVSNNFQMSSGVERYLEARGGGRRPLDAVDVQRIVASADGDQFFVDGELGMVDLGLHYGVSDTLSLSLHLSHLSYYGGVLDGVIWDFHDLFGISQAGRQYVRDDRFQMLFSDSQGTTFLLDRPSCGGLSDPTFGLRWLIPAAPKGWRLGLEAGFKVPLASRERYLSTGSFDFGAQLSAQRQWRRNAVILNLALVVPGDLDISERVDTPTLPSLDLAWVHRLGTRSSAVVQVLFSENIFRELTDSDLAEAEFQLTTGLSWETSLGRLWFGFTENLFNFDNTPDFAVHLSFAHLFQRQR